MSQPEKRTFDNVALRLRENRCVLVSAGPPFTAAYWPDIGVMASKLGLLEMTATALKEPEVQGRFLSTLAEQSLKDSRFQPAMIGFKLLPEMVRNQERFRQGYRVVTFLGACSRIVMMNGLEVMVGNVRPQGTLDVRFKQWDSLRDWALGQELIKEAISFLFHIRQLSCSITLFSELNEFDPGVWQFVYNHPRVRLAWLAADLIDCQSRDQFQHYCRDNSTFQNLEAISSKGLWPHIVLLVSKVNITVLPELVRALIEATRGASIELEPIPWPYRTKEGKPPWMNNHELIAAGQQEDCLSGFAPPTIEDYVETLVTIYRDTRVPLRLVEPLSWVAARIDSQFPLINSPAAVGSELAVLPNGDLYPGEWSVGSERWRLGNVLENSGDIQWERLDIIPEAVANTINDSECKSCDWRYRCGGVDATILWLEQEASESMQKPGTKATAPARDIAAGLKFVPREGQSLSQWYCAPRKRLFEEMLWGCIESATERKAGGLRERIHLREKGIDFQPVK